MITGTATADCCARGSRARMAKDKALGAIAFSAAKSASASASVSAKPSSPVGSDDDGDAEEGAWWCLGSE